MEENNIKLVNTKVELFYNIGIIFSLGILAFYPKEEEKQEKEIETPINLEDEEMKKSMPIRKKFRKIK